MRLPVKTSKATNMKPTNAKGSKGTRGLSLKAERASPLKRSIQELVSPQKGQGTPSKHLKGQRKKGIPPPRHKAKESHAKPAA